MSGRTLSTLHGDLTLPAFLPDATRGHVRGLDSADLEHSGVRACMVNSLHLAERPGITVVVHAGGIHGFMAFRGPVFSDSGGYQLYSLIRQSKSRGTITPAGFSYRTAGKRHLLTPQRAMERQWKLATDVVFCLDHCTHPRDPVAVQEESVRNTIRWAGECKSAHERLAERFGRRPWLFAVVQGGAHPGLRRQCADELRAIGFDGYGFGGWPVKDDGTLEEMVHRTAEMLRGERLHALGVGSPANVLQAARAGYGLFDCVIPTRDARHGRVYLSREPLDSLVRSEEPRAGFTSISLRDERRVRDGKPIEEGCDCACCLRYSRSYLYHLFTLEDPAGQRLATVHNLRFYARLMEALGRAGEGRA